MIMRASIGNHPEYLKTIMKKDALTSGWKGNTFSTLPDTGLEILQTLADAQVAKLAGLSILLAAYREEGQAGHGNLIIEDGAKIQGYVADMPDDFDIKANQAETRKCKSINQDGETGEPATVCVGSDNQIPEQGDVDFVATEGQWYKIRTGTAIVSKDPNTDVNSIEPKGMDMGSSLGVFPSLDWNSDRTIEDNASQSANVVHKADDVPWPWSNPPKSLEPAQYLNRLNQEQGIGPLPVPPPLIAPVR